MRPRAEPIPSAKHCSAGGLGAASQNHQSRLIKRVERGGRRPQKMTHTRHKTHLYMMTLVTTLVLPHLYRTLVTTLLHISTGHTSSQHSTRHPSCSAPAELVSLVLHLPAALDKVRAPLDEVRAHVYESPSRFSRARGRTGRGYGLHGTRSAVSFGDGEVVLWLGTKFY